MLTPFDDYAIHQTSLPVAHPASGDPNHYDRYFFNGYETSGAFFFAVALGIYPNRDVIDAAFSVLHAGVQRAVFASGRLPADRTRSRIGPITIEVVEPLRVNRVTVDASEHGIEADLTWDARTMAVEEPRQTQIVGAQVLQDSTRLTQLGRWRGTIQAGEDRLNVAPERVLGTKDRSWGIRWLGAPSGGAPPRDGFPGVFFLWAPVHFEDRCTHAILFEHPDGHRWYWSAAEITLVASGEPTWGNQDGLRRPRGLDYRLDTLPGTRRSRAATLELAFDGEVERQELEPILTFQMKGVGYLNAKWPHGAWHDEEAVGGDMWEVASLDPLAAENLHVEQLCRVRSNRGEGIGVLEQLILGPHSPTGFKDWTTGAPA